MDTAFRVVSGSQDSAVSIEGRRAGSAISSMRASKCSGRLGHLESDLLHFTCDSFAEHFKTMDRYTTLAAEQIVSQGKRVGAEATAAGSTVDFHQHILSQTWFSGWFRGTYDSVHGSALQFR